MHLDQGSAGPGSQRFFMSASPRLQHLYRHLGLWVLQGWLAMFFIGAAIAKLSQPHDLLVHLMQWPELVAIDTVRLTGALEMTLALGVLTPLASWRLFGPVLLVCLAAMLLETLCMAGYHLFMGHLGLASVNVVLAVFAGAVVYGRRPSASVREES